MPSARSWQVCRRGVACRKPPHPHSKMCFHSIRANVPAGYAPSIRGLNNTESLNGGLFKIDYQANAKSHINGMYYISRQAQTSFMAATPSAMGDALSDKRLDGQRVLGLCSQFELGE